MVPQQSAWARWPAGAARVRSAAGGNHNASGKKGREKEKKQCAARCGWLWLWAAGPVGAGSRLVTYGRRRLPVSIGTVVHCCSHRGRTLTITTCAWRSTGDMALGPRFKGWRHEAADRRGGRARRRLLLRPAAAWLRGTAQRALTDAPVTTSTRIDNNLQQAAIWAVRCSGRAEATELIRSRQGRSVAPPCASDGWRADIAGIDLLK